MYRRAIVAFGGVVAIVRVARSAMPTKLDPILAAMLDDPLAEADREVVLMVGLAGAATDQTLAELRGRGLSVRSVVGDVLTGTAPLGRVAAIADHPAIVKIEAATPLQPEPTPPPGG